MRENKPVLNPTELQEWQTKIETANHNNIFCHCSTCESEWIDSSLLALCPYCGSGDVEHISCWQFPDD